MLGTAEKDYEVNDHLKRIYISVLGDTEAFYHLQVVVDNDADLPSRYRKLVEETNNDIFVKGSG